HPVQRLVGGERGAEVAGPCVVVEGAQGGHEGRGGPAGGGGVLPRRVRQGPEDVLVRLGERLGGRGPARAPGPPGRVAPQRYVDDLGQVAGGGPHHGFGAVDGQGHDGERGFPHAA